MHRHTFTNTSLHQLSTHSDNDIQKKKKKNKKRHMFVHIWISIAIVCLVLDGVFGTFGCILFGEQRYGSWQMLVAVGLGDVGGRRVVGEVGGCAFCGPQMKISDSTFSVGGRQQLLTLEILDENSRVTEEENGLSSLRMEADRFTRSRVIHLRLLPLVIRTVLHLEQGHIRDRRKFAEETLAMLSTGCSFARKNPPVLGDVHGKQREPIVASHPF